MKHSLLLIVLFCLFLAQGCSPEIEAPVPTAGALDFSRFVTLGSSGTAGVTDGSIPFGAGSGLTEGGYFEKGQSLSFPSILARQFATTQAVPFVQPFLSGDGAGYASLAGFKPSNCAQAPSTPIFQPHDPVIGWKDNISDRGPFHNLAIPDLKARELRDREYMVCNPYSSRMLNGSAQADSITYLDWVQNSDPSFFSLWLGMEDVLHYALFGGKNEEYPLTQPDVFEEEVAALLEVLLSDEATKGVVLNIPDITRMPFFQTIGQQWTDGSCTSHPLFIQRGSSFEGVPSTADDHILLSALRLIENQGRGLRQNNPLNTKFVLDSEEAALVREYIYAYNLALERLVDQYNQEGPRVALVDMYGFYEEAYQGIQTHGILIDGQYMTGGFFSLDGIYPTGRGNALIANEVIETLNGFFPGVSLPPADITRFPGVAFP